MRFEERGVQAKNNNAANMSGFDVGTLYSTLCHRHWFSTAELARAAFQLQVCSCKRSKTKILLVYAVDSSAIFLPVITRLKKTI